MYALNTICFLCIFSVQTLFSWGLTAKMKGHVSSSISQFCVLFRKRRGVEGPVFLSSRNRAVGTRVTGAGGVQEKQSTPSPPDLYGNISKILSFKRSLITIYNIHAPADFETFLSSSKRAAMVVAGCCFLEKYVNPRYVLIKRQFIESQANVWPSPIKVLG